MLLAKILRPQQESGARAALRLTSLAMWLCIGAALSAAQPTEQRRSSAAAQDLRRLGTELTAEWVERYGEERLPGLSDDRALDLVEMDLQPLPRLSDATLRRLLTDALGHSLRDPWGTAYDVRWSRPGLTTGSGSDPIDGADLADEEPLGFAIRSCGPDRTCGSPALYTVGPQASGATRSAAANGTDPGADDLVWANGFFVRWPAGQ